MVTLLSISVCIPPFFSSFFWTRKQEEVNITTTTFFFHCIISSDFLNHFKSFSGNAYRGVILITD